MKVLKEEARTKVQLDTSREAENRQGFTSADDSNKGCARQYLLSNHFSYIYRYIDFGVLVKKCLFRVYPSNLRGSRPIGAYMLPAHQLVNKAGYLVRGGAHE